MVEIGNQGSKDLGYEGLIDLWFSKYDMPAQDFLNETDIRGTTSANGILDGSTIITGSNTFFDQDLDVNDVITLSSGSLKVQVISITNSTQIVVNTATGDGTSNQTLNFIGSRKFDFLKHRFWKS